MGDAWSGSLPWPTACPYPPTTLGKGHKNLQCGFGFFIERPRGPSVENKRHQKALSFFPEIASFFSVFHNSPLEILNRRQRYSLIVSTPFSLTYPLLPRLFCVTLPLSSPSTSTRRPRFFFTSDIRLYPAHPTQYHQPLPASLRSAR